jgi:hypothetical protein
MRKPTMLVTVFAASVAAALSAMGACSSPDGVTPMCTYNVGGNGLVHVANPCEGFAPCLDDAGKEQPAATCCVDGTGATLTGDALTTCLNGYGAGPPVASTSSASSSSSSSSSSSGGDGGP